MNRPRPIFPGQSFLSVVLSICIPLYNQQPEPQVRELLQQAEELELEVEIRLYDDGSQEEQKAPNRPLGNLPQVVYHELPENVGRSAIRNRLAADARYPTLLFLDGDVLPLDAHFLARYAQHLGQRAVVCGGLLYPEKPQQQNLLLHWRVGSQREVQPAPARMQQPYNRFLTCNFLCPREVFMLQRFDERLVGYGHEDTKFGWLLQHHQIPIRHLENPVIHLGLSTTEEFLDKTRQAVENLRRLKQSPELGGEWLNEIRLARMGQALERRAWAAQTLKFLAPKLIPRLERWLQQPRVPLRVFDLYKLLLLLR